MSAVYTSADQLIGKTPLLNSRLITPMVNRGMYKYKYP